VSQQRLDHNQIRPVFQEVGGETVTQRIHTLPANSGRRQFSTDFTPSLIGRSPYYEPFGLVMNRRWSFGLN
jgi:hypothetical protein